MRKKQYFLLVVLLVFTLAVLGGCGGSAEPEDEPTDFMAWQFAQAVTRVQIMRPMNAVYPRYKSEFVQRNEEGQFVITAYVNTLNEENETITYDFTVVANYIGNDMFEESSIDVKRR